MKRKKHLEPSNWVNRINKTFIENLKKFTSDLAGDEIS